MSSPAAAGPNRDTSCSPTPRTCSGFRSVSSVFANALRPVRLHENGLDPPRPPGSSASRSANERPSPPRFMRPPPRSTATVLWRSAMPYSASSSRIASVAPSSPDVPRVIIRSRTAGMSPYPARFPPRIRVRESRSAPRPSSPSIQFWAEPEKRFREWKLGHRLVSPVLVRLVVESIACRSGLSVAETVGLRIRSRSAAISGATIASPNSPASAPADFATRLASRPRLLSTSATLLRSRSSTPSAALASAPPSLGCSSRHWRRGRSSRTAPIPRGCRRGRSWGTGRAHGRFRARGRPASRSPGPG